MSLQDLTLHIKLHSAYLPTVQGIPVRYRDFNHSGCSVQAYRGLLICTGILVGTKLLIVSLIT